MKTFAKIVFIISLLANAYFIYDTIQERNREAFGKMFSRAFGTPINKTPWSKGFASLIAKLKQKDKGLASKKYYYINTWNTICNPCIREMPMLDSIAGTLHKDIAYVFVSDNTAGAVEMRLKGKFNMKHFVYLNDMNDFISAVCNERGIKGKTYPMQLILDQTGKLHYYILGAFENVQEADTLVKVIKGLD